MVRVIRANRLAWLAGAAVAVLALSSCAPAAPNVPGAAAPAAEAATTGAAPTPATATATTGAAPTPATATATSAVQFDLLPTAPGPERGMSAELATPIPLPGAAPEAAIPLEPTALPATEARTAEAATTSAAQAPAAEAATTGEERVVELEWPPQMRLGDSDIVRLALIPSAGGYTLTTEFEGNQTVTQTVEAPRPPGFDLSAIARLDAVSFDVGPAAEQRAAVAEGEALTFRWSISPRQAGQHRLAMMLSLLWTPQPGNAAPPRQAQVYSKAMTMDVDSVLGMTTAQAGSVGVIGLALGAGLSLAALALGRQRRAPSLSLAATPNAALAIEPHAEITLDDDERMLLRTLFRRYDRVSVEGEFRSGYSGARTLLCLPIRAGGRSDAYSIAKLGERRAIEAEFDNYEAFVKDTLPPITARIQEPPVRPAAGASPRSALRYTFIGEPGRMPRSLREALRADPDPALLHRLFDTFGPNWWMQRTPYSFRVAQEYDRMLPAHAVVEVAGESARATRTVSGAQPPAAAAFALGETIALRDFDTIEPRADGVSFSLTGRAAPGQPPLRVRVRGPFQPGRATPYRVIATRETLLRELSAEFELFGLPDPIARIAAVEQRTLHGTRSPIHGDLNLENALVGPGGIVWLIDFAQTREGHTLYDFAHLEAELVAQCVAPNMPSARDYAAALPALAGGVAQAGGPLALIGATREMAWRCLFNPAQPGEYWTALYMASLGALKFANLDAHQRHLLYLTAAHAALQIA